MNGLINIITTFSFYNSIILLNELIEKVGKKCKYIAFNDTNLVSLHQNVNDCLEKNIKPIIGLNFYISFEDKKYHITSYVLNSKGFNNILKLNYLKQNTIEYSSLIEMKEGLLFIIEFNEIYSKQNYNDLSTLDFINKLSKELNNFNLGFSLNTSLFNYQSISFLTEHKSDIKVKIYPFHYYSYIDSGDKELYSLIKSIKNHQRKDIDNDYNILDYETFKEFYFKYPFIDDYDSINDLVTFEYSKFRYTLPTFPNDDNLNSDDYLRLISFQGLENRLKNKIVLNKDEYISRLNKELDVITKCGFSDYFLIVYDLLKHCRKNDILYGPGRGSCVSSLVSFSLKITAIDPLIYNLIFERFLNADRATMPDIDIDISSDKRNEVIEYLSNRYGSTRVASLSVLEHFSLDSVIKDVFNYYKINETRIPAITKSLKNNLIDDGDDETLVIKNVNDAITKLVKGNKTHPSGIIIASHSLFDYLPIEHIGVVNQIEYDESVIKQFGLLKLDLLSSNFLTLLKKIVDLIKIKDKQFDLFNIPLSDTKTLEAFKNKSNDIFQLSSDISNDLLRRANVSRFSDLANIISLIRPGAQDNIELYIKNKTNPNSIDYLHKDLEDILKSTYGVLLFQEQVMSIAHKFGGYSMRESDKLRKFISDKDTNKFTKEQTNFINKGINNGYSEELLIELFQLMLKFGGYGFNKSHAVAYSFLAYAQLYLKVNYPLEYYTATLNNEKGLLKTILSELTDNKINLLKPSINFSYSVYSIEGSEIRMPLTSIKGISKETSDLIVSTRKDNKYSTLYNFKNRVEITNNEYTNLVHGFAFDEFGFSHKALIEKEIALLNKNIEKDDVFIEEYSSNLLYNFEKDIFGTNIYYDSFIQYKDFLNKFKTVLKVSEYVKKEKKINDIFKVIGFVTQVREISDKNNSKMAFLLFTDNITEITVTMFSNDYQQFVKENLNVAFVFQISYSKYQEKDSYRVMKYLKVEVN